MGAFIEKKNFKCIDNEDNTNNTTSTVPTSLSEDIICNTIIGYSTFKSTRIVFLVISIIGLVLNSILLKDIFSKKFASKNRKKSSMKKLFSVLIILDNVTGVYWILSSVLFWNAKKIQDYQSSCGALSIIYFSVFTFEFIFINFILINFRKISLNPIEGILRPGKI